MDAEKAAQADPASMFDEAMLEQLLAAKQVWREYYGSSEMEPAKMVFDVWKRTNGKRHLSNEEGGSIHRCVAGVCLCVAIPVQTYKLTRGVVQQLLASGEGDLRNVERRHGHVTISLADYVWVTADQTLHVCLGRERCPFLDTPALHAAPAPFRAEGFICKTAWTPHYCGDDCEYLEIHEGVHECVLTGRQTSFQHVKHWHLDKVPGGTTTKFVAFKKLVPRNTRRIWFSTDFLCGKQLEVVKQVLRLGPAELLIVKRLASRFRARGSRLCQEYYFYASIYIAAMLSNERFERERQKEQDLKRDFEVGAQRLIRREGGQANPARLYELMMQKTKNVFIIPYRDIDFDER